MDLKFFLRLVSTIFGLILFIESAAIGFLIDRDWINDLLPPSDFKLNSTLRDTLFSCLEEESYEGINNYVNCHIFCPSCRQGFGQCISSGNQKLCICECQYPVQLHRECRSIQRYCRTEEISEYDTIMKSCKEVCVKQGFSDGALCGLDDPPIALPTCTCLCPKLFLD